VIAEDFVGSNKQVVVEPHLLQPGRQTFSAAQ
jgi:hypothetical protein